MNKIKIALIKAFLLIIIILSATGVLLSVLAILTYCLSPEWATISFISIIFLLLFIILFILEYKY